MSVNPIERYNNESDEIIKQFGNDAKFQEESRHWLEQSMRKSYVYNFYWMGRPIIQNPIDIMGLQEIIWNVQPDLIIETGIAHGGSLIFSASMLELNAASGGPEGAEVLGIDIDIREHNREAIESHSMFKRISMIQGSSISNEVIEQVKQKAKNKKRILVCLDSNHTHEHVMEELQAYAPLVDIGSYCIVYDTFVEDVPEDVFSDRPWSHGDNPKTAVWEFLKTNDKFEIDKAIQNKLMITVAPDGFLKRVR